MVEPEQVQGVRPSAAVPRLLQLALDFALLTKPGIVSFLLFTACSAMVVAQGGAPPLGRAIATLLGLALTSGGANAVNMWYDRDIDAVMSRTQNRPIPSGRLPAEAALLFGVGSGALGVGVLLLAVNALAACLAAAGYLYYVLVYTCWLKRRTPQNIVVGGAAGAFPPLVGWAAATGHLDVSAWLMFLMVFLWTPPHFWALALARLEDYRQAQIPMMPVVHGEVATKRQSLAYAAALLLTSLSLSLTHRLDALYAFVALGTGTGFLAANVALLLRHPDDRRAPRRVFLASLAYVVVVFAAMMAGVPGHSAP